MIATEKINNYAKEVYGNTKKLKVGYDYYNMGNYNTDGFGYDLKDNVIFDYNLFENAGTTIPYKQDYQKIINSFEESISFEDFSIECTIDADNYDNKYYKLVVYKMSNTNILSESESLTIPAEITMQFIESMEIQYNFTSVNIFILIIMVQNKFHLMDMTP